MSSGEHEARRRRWWKRVTRDSILFTVGLAGIIHEAATRGVERPTLLLIFAGMVGLPAFIQRDERRDDGPKP